MPEQKKFTQLEFAPPTTLEHLLGKTIDEVPFATSPLHVAQLSSPSPWPREYLAVLNYPLDAARLQYLLGGASMASEFGTGIRDMLADLELPDLTDPQNRMRVDRHEKSLGSRHWQDFLMHRPSIMETLGTSDVQRLLLSPQIYGQAKDRVGQSYPNLLVGLKEQDQQQRVVNLTNYFRRMVIPDQSIPATHQQTIRSVAVQFLGDSTIEVRIGNAYIAQAKLEKHRGDPSEYTYRLVPASVRDVNILYSVLWWRKHSNGRRSFNVGLLNEQDADQVRELVGINAPAGSAFARERLSTLLGVSVILCCEPPVKEGWHGTYTYHEIAKPKDKKFFQEEEGWGNIKQTMGPVQVLGLQLVRRREIVQRSSLLPAIELYVEQI